MAKKVDSTATNANANLQMIAEQASVDEGFVVHYNLRDELALHSVEIVDGLPNLGYKRSLNVPTFQENDLATVCRLVSEKTHPEFYYLPFLPNHPMHSSRFFKTYSPEWLQDTGVGELLADVDEIMKHLHIGKSLSEGSQSKDLASRLDFPIDGCGKSIIMSCDYVRVQEGSNIIIFPEPPKIKIADGSSSSCSDYLTKNFQWFAYTGEHKLLKYQELIKHIVAIEWLYRNGIHANSEWMMSHSSKPADTNSTRSTRKKPPYKMMPELGVVKKPTSYDEVQTVEAIEYECRKKEYGAIRKCGYIDFKSAQMMENGIPSSSLKFIKLCIKADLYFLNAKDKHHNLMIAEVEGVENTKIHKRLPATSQPPSASMQIPVDKQECDQEITQFFQDCISLIDAYLPLKVTTTISEAPSDHYTAKNPNMPVMPGLTPNVKSWDELEKSKSVPIPWIWEHPFPENAVAIASGGVTTHGFNVKTEALQQPREAYSETQQFQKKGLVVVKGEHACGLTFNPPSFEKILPSFMTPPSLQIGLNYTTVKINHRIGSWNLQSCTVKKLNDCDVMTIVCSIILNNNLDILAFQETGKGVLQKICSELNRPTLLTIESLKNNSKNWNCWSEEKAGRMFGGMEYAGFLWNESARVTCHGVQKITSPHGKIMVRMPIAGKFLIGCWEVVLVNLHLKADSTKKEDKDRLQKELDHLPTLVSICSPNGEDVILIGDFNKAPDDPDDPDEKNFLPLKKAGYTNIFHHTEWTNISSKNPDGSKSYDNIWVSSQVMETRHNGFKVVIREGLILQSKRDKTVLKTVSDHCPIWAGFYQHIQLPSIRML